MTHIAESTDSQGKILVFCDCSEGLLCPQGKGGAVSSRRCGIWVDDPRKGGETFRQALARALDPTQVAWESGRGPLQLDDQPPESPVNPGATDSD